ncbi:MAG: DUF2264 domain-containing protein [Clostridia bacterium]|nr:DUF2264 domain-containing protein [Clostridia bacterium]
MPFCVQEPNYTLSPFTGMTRKHWFDAAIYLLDGIFKHIYSVEDPLLVPRKEFEVSYPHDLNDAYEVSAEKLEGFARSFLMASPVIHNNPKVKCNNISLLEYYKTQLLILSSREHPNRAGWFDQHRAVYPDPGRSFQQVVEACAIVIALDGCHKEIYDTLTPDERAQVNGFLRSYAVDKTYPNNWRFFNMMILAFLYKNGEDIPRDIMMSHTKAMLDFYSGDGWYRDGNSFDFYSCWTFQTYAPLWNNWYGYENAPVAASMFENYSNELLKTYAYLFSRNGHMLMWGRSIIYRFAATAAFAGNAFLRNSIQNYGLSRRVCSGTLLQFISRDDTLDDGVPTMGFYRNFPQLLQYYSCAESIYWMSKAFVCLYLPEDHPFWTESENEQGWPNKQNEVTTYHLQGPGLVYSNYANTGSTIMRPSRVFLVENAPNLPTYARLSYHTEYPWEAVDSNTPTCCPMQYTRIAPDGKIQIPNAILYGGFKDDIFYRRLFFGYDRPDWCGRRTTMILADTTLPNGILRCDKMTTYDNPGHFVLSSFGFPDNGTTIETYSEGKARAIVLSGKDSQGNPKQMAMTIFEGFEDIFVTKHTGTNPESTNSIVICANTKEASGLYPNGPWIFISQVITKESQEPFTQDELFPISSISMNENGGIGDVEINLKNGEKRTISHAQFSNVFSF